MSPDVADAALDEAGRLAAEVLAPLNHTGDQQASVLENGVVRTPAGFREAYRQFVDGGWNGLQCDPAYGGQGLPWLLGTAIQEMWASSNMAFSLCPLLTQAEIELLQEARTKEQRDLYLPKPISGEWSGDDEPDGAGGRVRRRRLRSRAVREGDAYRIVGQKIFITYGEHDLAENIVHLVLARTAGRPGGHQGDIALHRAEIPARFRRLSGPAQ